MFLAMINSTVGWRRLPPISTQCRSLPFMRRLSSGTGNSGAAALRTVKNVTPKLDSARAAYLRCAYADVIVTYVMFWRRICRCLLDGEWLALS